MEYVLGFICLILLWIVYSLVVFGKEDYQEPRINDTYYKNKHEGDDKDSDGKEV